MKSLFYQMISYAAIFLLYACGPTTSESASDLTSSGWEKFEAQDYRAADSLFLSALDVDSTFADAYTGLGWSALKTDLLPAAIIVFNAAITNGADRDAYAGKAYADLNLNDQTSAIGDVDAALAVSSTYTFSHDVTITETDLLWIKARAQFLKGQYSQAQSIVNILAPSNTLNPSSPTYIPDLAALIESLRTTV